MAIEGLENGFDSMADRLGRMQAVVGEMQIPRRGHATHLNDPKYQAARVLPDTPHWTRQGRGGQKKSGRLAAARHAFFLI